MSYTVSLQQRIQQLKAIGADIPKVLGDISKKATIAAIEAAEDATPPKAGTGRGSHIGTNTTTGELKAHWSTDSKKNPQNNGGRYTTVLANDMKYASFVDQGHRMDKHFVPGLYVNPDSGLLEYDPEAKTGLVVGTKTLYVKGEFMVDKAKEAYEKTVLTELEKKIPRLIE